MEKSSRSTPRADGRKAQGSPPSDRRATADGARSGAPGGAATADRAQSGASAEALAGRFLESQGLTIVARNFRIRRGEIDLIARDGATLVFVEVRFRRSQSHGGAAESITAAKRARLVAAAQAFLLRQHGDPPCRFDAILLDSLDPARVDRRRNELD
jgi:putative endonuclease